MRASGLVGHLAVALVAVWASLVVAEGPAAAQKSGGTLRLSHNDTPPSTSLLEESTIASVTPFAAIFNNLVVFDPAKPHESLKTVIGDLAESWSWDPTSTKLTCRGCRLPPQPAKSVVWEPQGRFDQWRLRGDLRAVRAAAASAGAVGERVFPGLSLPCSPAGDAHKTCWHGSIKLVAFKRGDSIRLVRNPDYFKKGRPYLDEITFRVIDSRATRILAFSTGEFDITFPSDRTVALIRDVKERAPQAICEKTNSATQINLMVNRANPPFDNPAIRRAIQLAIDRKSFNTVLMEGQGLPGGAMLPQPVGEWGMPPEMVSQLTGYVGDTAQNNAQAQAIMRGLGYSEARPLQIKIKTRNLPTYRDPAVILVDQLTKIYISSDLDILDTPRWYARLAKKDYTIALNVTGVSVDDPEGNIVENYSCRSERNYTQYCNPDVDRLLAAQSRELDKSKREKLVWDIERILAEDAARPSIVWGAVGAIAGSLM
jgi:peptide/nickel transport system substrate-binding protein